MRIPVLPDLLAEIIPEIVEAGIKIAPRELCGLICSDGTLFWLTNESEREREFFLSSAQLDVAFNGVDGVSDLGLGMDQVVLWHTHPSGSLSPSRADLESRKQWPELMHMVIALPGGEATYY